MLRRHSPTLASPPSARLSPPPASRESADLNIFDQVRVRKGPSPPAGASSSTIVAADAGLIVTPPRRRPSKSDKRDFLRRRPAAPPAVATPRVAHQEHVHERSISYLPPPLQPRRSRSYDRMPSVAVRNTSAPHHHANKQPLKSILKPSASTPALPMLAAVEDYDTFGSSFLRAASDAGRADVDGDEDDDQVTLEQFLRLDQRDKQAAAAAAVQSYPPRGHSLSPITKFRGDPTSADRPPLPPPQLQQPLPPYRVSFRSRHLAPPTALSTAAATHARNLSDAPLATDDSEGWSELAMAISATPYRSVPILFSTATPSVPQKPFWDSVPPCPAPHAAAAGSDTSGSDSASDPDPPRRSPPPPPYFSPRPYSPPSVATAASSPPRARSRSFSSQARSQATPAAPDAAPPTFTAAGELSTQVWSPMPPMPPMPAAAGIGVIVPGTPPSASLIFGGRNRRLPAATVAALAQAAAAASSGATRH
ncbi:hypothetical protein HK405_014559 [Cladochytrium tenue]|nr:hypothetical protein HK405_014559 [Cladochytrium tenue]